jgi:hypothetical protein
MNSVKFNYFLERAIIIFVCLWGSWALYYSIAVLVFDASYRNLKDFSLILVFQIAGSLFFLYRTNLLSNSEHNKQDKLHGFALPGNFSRRFYSLCAGATCVAVIAVYLVDIYRISSTSFTYNLVWALLLPAVLINVFSYPSQAKTDAPMKLEPAPMSSALDILVLVICTAILAFGLYGSGFPTPDDAYYGWVISSTLANPDLPILGQDLLLGTDAPFVIHPAYRTVGYEVLIAFVGDITGIDPLRVYYDMMPVAGAISWIVAAYMFVRTIGAPYPGIAVAASLAGLLFWTEGGFAPGGHFAALFWGKSLLFLVSAPMLFVFTAAFLRDQNIRGWILLLLSVAATGTWSSTALFITPLCVGLAFLVFTSSIKVGVRAVIPIALALSPIVLAMAYSVSILSRAPVGESGYNAGLMRVQGEAFGTVSMQLVVLLMLVILPMAARTAGLANLHRNLRRISLAGYFTVMTPYMLETIAVISGSNFLASRLQYAYPSILLTGILASLAIYLLVARETASCNKSGKYAAIATALAFYLCFFGMMEKDFLFGDRWKKATVYLDDFNEAKAARDLIPNDAVVAAGDLDDILPILPDPPTFTYVRHYIHYYSHFLSDSELMKRSVLYNSLSTRLPIKEKGLETTISRVVSSSDSLGVTTLVFHTPDGRHRPLAGPTGFQFRASEKGGEQETFVNALNARLSTEGYECSSTPSGRTRVCNRESDASAN